MEAATRQAQLYMTVHLGDVVVGMIHQDSGKTSMYGRCATCGARLTRTLLPGRRSQGYQGRPLGFLAAWLRQPCRGDAQLHRQVVVVGISLSERREARSALEGQPDYLAFASHERPLREGEDAEPPTYD